MNAAVKASNEVKNIQTRLNAMGLPPYLIDMMKMNTLGREVAVAREHLRALNEQMDAWEIANPHAVHLLPWYEERKKWKEAGCPEPEWYELLWLLQCPNYPIQKTEISHFEYNGAGAKLHNQKTEMVKKGLVARDDIKRKYTKKIKPI